MPISALIRLGLSCDNVSDHSPFFIRNQVRSDTSPSNAQTSGPVRRQISMSRAIPSMADGVTRARDIAIVDVLLRRAAKRSWPTIKAIMDADDELARKLVARIASHFEFGTPFYQDFDEHDVADFYRLVTRLYPPSSGVERQFTGAWDTIGYLRDGLPRHLTTMGTETAVTLLNRLIAEYPQLTGLAYELTLAEKERGSDIRPQPPITLTT